MSGLLASNHPGSIQPSQPASALNVNSNYGLKVLQMAAYDLHHLYDVYGWCLDD